MSDLSVSLGPLRLRNPIATASGTFGYGLEFSDVVDLSRIGAIATKGLSLRPHDGNPPPRICETPAGMLNAIGLQNVGIEAFLSEKLPKLREADACVIANIWGDDEEDYVAIARALDQAPGLAALELNISCPNVSKGGMLFGNDPVATLSLVAKVRRATAMPLVVKLSPNAPDLVESARAASEAGRRRAVAREHVCRHGDRSRNRQAPDLIRHGRPFGPRDPPAGGADGVPGPPGPADRAALGNRRNRDAFRRLGIPARRRVRGAGRNGELPRSGSLAAAGGRAGGVLRSEEDRSGGPRRQSAAMKARDRICLALDVASADEARALARRFSGKVGWLKIGLELFVSEGPPLVRELSRSAKVFLDLKLHDIPATVAGAIRAAVRTGAAMVNVHASGGREMMRRAADAARNEAAQLGNAAPRVIGVTVLTSLDETALFEVGIAGSPDEAAARLAHLAKESGLDGVVCSRLDLTRIRAACGPDFWTVVPGIRPAAADAQDQKRIGTPREALAAGATILVIGRPITQAADPEAALAAIVAEMES